MKWMYLSLLLALGGMLAATGCGPTLSPQGRTLLGTSYEAYEAGRDQAVIENTTALLRLHPNGPRNDEALLLRGMAHHRLKQHVQARADLQAAADAASQNDVLAMANYNLGSVAYEMGDLRTAERSLAAAIDLLGSPQEPAKRQMLAGAHYRLGMTMQRTGQWQEADQQFFRVVHLAPNTDMAQQASGRINSRAWSVQAGAYDSKARADAAAGQLRQQKLPATVQPDRRAPARRWLVLVGRFASLEEASEMLPAVARFQSDAFIATVE